MLGCGMQIGPIHPQLGAKITTDPGLRIWGHHPVDCSTCQGQRLNCKGPVANHRVRRVWLQAGGGPKLPPALSAALARRPRCVQAAAAAPLAAPSAAQRGRAYAATGVSPGRSTFPADAVHPTNLPHPTTPMCHQSRPVSRTSAPTFWPGAATCMWPPPALPTCALCSTCAACR